VQELYSRPENGFDQKLKGQGPPVPRRVLLSGPSQ
jgi:hypothetical protein